MKSLLLLTTLILTGCAQEEKDKFKDLALVDPTEEAENIQKATRTTINASRDYKPSSWSSDEVNIDMDNMMIPQTLSANYGNLGTGWVELIINESRKYCYQGDARSNRHESETATLKKIVHIDDSCHGNGTSVRTREVRNVNKVKINISGGECSSLCSYTEISVDTKDWTPLIVRPIRVVR